jgi:hypothetical protein
MASGERKRVRDCGVGDTGKNGDAALEFGEELDGTLGRVAMQARVDGHGQNAAGAETDVDRGGGAKAAQTKAGDAEKNERHCNLRHDKKVAEGPEAARAGKNVFPFQSGRGEAPCCGPGGKQSEENAGGKAEKKGKEENVGVDTDVQIDRDGYGKAERGETVGGPRGDENTEEAAAKRKKHALGKDLAKKLRAVGAQGYAHGHFMLASGGLRQEKIGDVGAGDEQNEKDDDHERGEKK